MTEICQNALRFAPWMDVQSRRLPGIMPLKMADWLTIDEVYASQIARKAALLETRGPDVHMLAPGALPAAQELLDLVLVHLGARTDFEIAADRVETPDGRVVLMDRDRPLEALAQLVQEDLCILEKRGDEHVLTGALLCFPASWTLAEKFERPLLAIHAPVPEYDADIGRRVQRLFDAVRPERPLWRANALRYVDPELFQPRTLSEDRTRPAAGGFIRSERQSILRLPVSNAVVFSIHTTVIPDRALSAAQRAGLKDHPIHSVSEVA